MAANPADLFEHAADAFAERVAVACGDRQVTYRELDERSSRLAHHLAGTGVAPGDHVGLYARRPLVAAIEAHLRGLIAGYKLPRSIWLVDAIGRTAAGKADYGWAHQHVAGHPPARPPGAESLVT
jgi:acyl-CoA synthetase (AMP-forming)/AMP-acid ligase II